MKWPHLGLWLNGRRQFAGRHSAKVICFVLAQLVALDPLQRLLQFAFFSHRGTLFDLRWFAELIRKKLQWGMHRSVAEFNVNTTPFIDAHNKEPKPRNWVKSANETLASVGRLCLKANELGMDEWGSIRT